jgi:hypothetical protein
MLLSVLYVLGLAIHWWLKATASVTGVGQVATIKQWLAKNNRALVARTFIATLFFIVWLRDPQIVTKAALILAGHLAPGPLRSIVEGIQVPLNVLTAGAFGYFCDSLLDKLVMRVPWLSNDLPKANGESKADSAAAGE